MLGIQLNAARLNQINFTARKKPQGEQIAGYTREGDCFVRQETTDGGVRVTNVIRSSSKFEKHLKRIEALTTPNEEGQVVLVDSKKEKTVLPRPLSSDEVQSCENMGILNKNDRIKILIDLKDKGLDTKDAMFIATSMASTQGRFSEMTSVNKDGICTVEDNKGETHTISRALTPKEAICILSIRNKKMPFDRLQAFADFKDNYGLSDEDALNLTTKKSFGDKFICLTTPNKDGAIVLENKDGEKTTLQRALTPKEALPVLSLDDDKIKAYQEILDMDVSIQDAFSIAKNSKRISKFFALTKPQENGKAVITNKDETKTELERPLTPKEALIAMNEAFSTEKISEQLSKNGEITSTKRHRAVNIIA